MSRKTFGLTFVSALFVLVFAFDADAWMDPWAPAFKAAPASVQALSRTSVSNYVCAALGYEFGWKYSEGYALDLNDDGTEDQVFIVPWMGNGLNASGYDVHFLVSNGVKGRRKSVMEGYGVEPVPMLPISN